MGHMFKVHPKFRDGMNIYTMFMANDEATPFWVTKWSAQALLVTRVHPLSGPAPYFGNPIVEGTLYSLFLDGQRTDTFWPVENRKVTSAGSFNWLWVLPDAAKISNLQEVRKD